MSTPINDFLYGENVRNMLFSKPWSPSGGTYPTLTTEGVVFIAEDAGVVSGTTYNAGDAIIRKDGVWESFGGGTTQWIVINTATPLTSGLRYLLDYDSGSFDVTLPASPLAGDEIDLLHVRGDVTAFAPTYPQIVQNASDENIDGLDENMDIDVNYEPIKLVFSGFDPEGWRVS